MKWLKKKSGKEEKLAKPIGDFPAKILSGNLGTFSQEVKDGKEGELKPYIWAKPRGEEREPVQIRVWLHSFMGNPPRAHHLAMHGKAVMDDQHFKLLAPGGKIYQPRAPHDPELPLCETEECRCVTVPKILFLNKNEEEELRAEMDATGGVIKKEWEESTMEAAVKTRRYSTPNPREVAMRLLSEARELAAKQHMSKNYMINLEIIELSEEHVIRYEKALEIAEARQDRASELETKEIPPHTLEEALVQPANDFWSEYSVGLRDRLEEVLHISAKPSASYSAGYYFYELRDSSDTEYDPPVIEGMDCSPIRWNQLK